MSDIEEKATLLPRPQTEGSSFHRARTTSTAAKITIVCSLVLASVVAICSMYPGVNGAISTKVTNLLNVPNAVVAKYDNGHGPNGEVYCNELGQGECLERIIGYCTKHGPCVDDPRKHTNPTELPTSQPTTIFLNDGCNPDDPPCKEWFLGFCTLHYHCHEEVPCPEDGEKKAVDDDSNEEEGPTEGGAPVEPAPEPAPAPVEPEPAPEPVPIPATSAPTKAPKTSKPTKAPKTSKPTKAPKTKKPSAAPISEPTRSPKAAPTHVPVTSPTAMPVTANPTFAPTTLAPIADPTARPIIEPTGTPTPMPSSHANCNPENPPCLHDFLGICYMYVDCGAVGNHDNYSFHTPFHFMHTHSPTLEPTPAIPCDPENPPCTEWYLGFCMKLTDCSIANHTETHEPVHHPHTDDEMITPTDGDESPASNSTLTSIVSAVLPSVEKDDKKGLRSKKSME